MPIESGEKVVAVMRCSLLEASFDWVHSLFQPNVENREWFNGPNTDSCGTVTR